MGKSKKNSQTQGVDDVTAGRQQAVWNAAQQYAHTPLAGVNPAVAQAQQNFQGAASAGNLGLSALSGNQQAYGQLANPYQQNVIDATNAQWDRQAANVTNTLAARAAAANAFGGSREAISEGQGLGDLANSQMQQIAGLNYQGFNDTQNRAAQLAQLGQQANGASANLGMYQTQQAQAAQAHPFDALAAGYGVAGHHGDVATQKQSGNLFGDILGAASLGASFIPGVGQAAGAIGGQLASNSLGGQGLNLGLNAQGGLGIW